LDFDVDRAAPLAEDDVVVEEEVVGSAADAERGSTVLEMGSEVLWM
jgi:hypothetical protein